MLIPKQKNVSTIIFKSNGNSNVYLYLAFLAQNGEGTVQERSKICWQRPENGDEQNGNGNGSGIKERKNYCNVTPVIYSKFIKNVKKKSR